MHIIISKDHWSLTRMTHYAGYHWASLLTFWMQQHAVPWLCSATFKGHTLTVKLRKWQPESSCHDMVNSLNTFASRLKFKRRKGLFRSCSLQNTEYVKHEVMQWEILVACPSLLSPPRAPSSGPRLLCCCDVGAGIKGHNTSAQHQSPVEQWWVPGAEHYTGHRWWKNIMITNGPIV